MSAEEADLFTDLDSRNVLDCFAEPSYISEVARKMRDLNLPLGYTRDELSTIDQVKNTWRSITENHAVRLVSFIVNFEMEDGDSDLISDDVGYDDAENVPYGQSQEIGSDKVAMGPGGGVEQKEWRSYKLIKLDGISNSEIGSGLDDAGWNELGSRLRNSVDPTVTKDEKMEIIKSLSRSGNMTSMNVEWIAQDVFERQFQYYDETGSSPYNDPGPDFWVVDGDQRDHGLVIEVSSRFVNALGDTYISSKTNSIIDMEEEDEFEDVPYDLAILAPKFTKRSENRYEKFGEPGYHDDPEGDMVHLHRVPNPEETIYRHFLEEDVRQAGNLTGGTPIIVPDIERVQQRLIDGNQVGDNYPVVDDEFRDFEDQLDYVNRLFDIISESRYRNMLREAIEPLLWEFVRPYKIEQFLIDTYWDKGLTQSEIGRLVDKTAGTIGRWMRGGLKDGKWDVVRRGTGAPNIDRETMEVWKSMYIGADPFPEPYSAYRIQAEYNRFPFWDLDDWETWHSEFTEEERMEWMREQDSYRDNLSYTVLVGAGQNRFQPSYSFILRSLRDMGVEIRAPDEAPMAPYTAYSNNKTIEWMINRDVGLVAKDTEGRDLVRQEDVEVFDSYLEVDISTWLSENDVSYAHEPFTIPSIYGPNRDQWERMVTAIRAVGMSFGSRSEAMEMYESVKREAEESDSDNRIDELILGNNFDEFVGRILPIWNEIYGKHNLGDEERSPDPLPALEFFDKRYVIPDIVVYRGETSQERGLDWTGWDNWSHILEVSGLWAIDIPADVDENEWWDWYRVSGVAFKEFAYRLLGLWEYDDGSPRVMYLVPFQPDITGVTDGIPDALRDDDNYVIFSTTQNSLGLEELKVQLGVTAEDIETGLSPPIELISYERDRDSPNITPVEYEYDGINISATVGVPEAYPVGDETIVYWGDLGEVFITPDSVHVKESMWLTNNMLMLREYVTDVMSRLEDEGVVESMRVVL